MTIFMVCSSYGQEKVKGFYHPFKKTFIANIVRPLEQGDEHENYVAKNFIEDLSVVEMDSKNFVLIGTTLRVVYFKGFGVIDTAGIVRVPIIYDELKPLYSEENKFYLFVVGDSTGVVDNKGDELLRLHRNIIADVEITAGKLNEYYENSILQNKLQSKFLRTFNHELIIVEKGLNRGLFSLSQRKYLIPLVSNSEDSLEGKSLAGLAPISVKGDLALCKDEGGFRLVDLKTLKYTNKYDFAYLLDNGAFYIRHEQKHWIADNVDEPQTIFSYELIEAKKIQNTRGSKFPKRQGTYEFVVMKEGKLGVYDANGKELIPIIYDDIYLTNYYVRSDPASWYWLKKNGQWALSNHLHELQTKFEFLDIDQLNKVSYDNFIYFYKIDTSNLHWDPDIDTTTMERYSSHTIYGYGRVAEVRTQITRLSLASLAMPKVLDRKMIHSSTPFGKKQDGYHLITLGSAELAQVDTNQFDRVITQAGNRVSVGVMKEGKYGYYRFHGGAAEPVLKYDGLVYLAYGEYKYAYVKRKNIYRRSYHPYTSKKSKFKKWRKYEDYILSNSFRVK